MLWVRHYVFDVALWRRKHLTVGGGLPTICREPAAKPAHAVYQVHSGAAAQPIAAVVTSESSHALRAEAGSALPQQPCVCCEAAPCRRNFTETLAPRA